MVVEVEEEVGEEVGEVVFHRKSEPKNESVQ